MTERIVAFTLFPDVTLLDVVGPLQVLKSLPRRFGARCSLRIAT